MKFEDFPAIYIPLWLRLNFKDVYSGSPIYDIYIPLWLRLNKHKPKHMTKIKYIYIPLWLRLNVNDWKDIYSFEKFTFHYGLD